jgi:hypothetical protein
VIENDPSIKTIVGHSLAGSVALQLQNDLKDRNLNVTTYGAPVASITQSSNRYRNPGDPISILDSGTVKTPEAQYNLNPLKAHAFTNFSNVSQKDTGWFKNNSDPKNTYMAPMRPMVMEARPNDNWDIKPATNQITYDTKTDNGVLGSMYNNIDTSQLQTVDM